MNPAKRLIFMFQLSYSCSGDLVQWVWNLAPESWFDTLVRYHASASAHGYPDGYMDCEGAMTREGICQSLQSRAVTWTWIQNSEFTCFDFYHENEICNYVPHNSHCLLSASSLSKDNTIKSAKEGSMLVPVHHRKHRKWEVSGRFIVS